MKYESKRILISCYFLCHIFKIKKSALKKLREESMDVGQRLTNIVILLQRRYKHFVIQATLE